MGSVVAHRPVNAGCHLPTKTRRIIKRAVAANIAIQEAAWAAVGPWHELDAATICTGILTEKYGIATGETDDSEKRRNPSRRQRQESRAISLDSK